MLRIVPASAAYRDNDVCLGLPDGSIIILKCGPLDLRYTPCVLRLFCVVSRSSRKVPAGTILRAEMPVAGKAMYSHM